MSTVAAIALSPSLMPSARFDVPVSPSGLWDVEHRDHWFVQEPSSVAALFCSLDDAGTTLIRAATVRERSHESRADLFRSGTSAPDPEENLRLITPLESEEDKPNTLLEQAVRTAVQSIEDAINEDIEENQTIESPVPSSGDVKACLELAERILAHVTFAPKMRFAATIEESGELALVFQSLLTNRRLSCRFLKNGTSLDVCKTDEMISCTRSTTSTGSANARELARWLTHRA